MAELNAEGAVEAYVFQGGSLVSPGEQTDAMVFGGLKRKLVFDTFGGPEKWSSSGYVEVPRLDGKGSMAGFMLEHDAPLPEGWRSVPIRQVLSLAVAPGSVAGTGPEGGLFRVYHIMQWRRESVYCGSCGNPNGDAPNTLARKCPVCGRMEFPRISPAIIVLITNHREEILLAHNNNFADGIYSLIAGFNEAGESLEDTVAREVMEETGITVDHIHYETSQPWPFPNSLMLGFTARYVSGIVKPDGIEIADVRWFSRDKLPNLPGSGSVSRYLINRWIGVSPDATV